MSNSKFLYSKSKEQTQYKLIIVRPVREFVGCARGQIQWVINLIYHGASQGWSLGHFPLGLSPTQHMPILIFYIYSSLICSLKLV